MTLVFLVNSDRLLALFFFFLSFRNHNFFSICQVRDELEQLLDDDDDMADFTCLESWLGHLPLSVVLSDQTGSLHPQLLAQKYQEQAEPVQLLCMEMRMTLKS
jgi:hypothetical protein